MMSDAFASDERCVVSLSVNDTEYSGEAKWSLEEGFVANLEGYFSGKFAGPDEIPELLPIEIGKSQRALVVKPTLIQMGMNMAVGQPLVTPIQIRSDVVVHGLPWDIPNELRLQKIRVECEALRLWYGEDTATVEMDKKGQKTTVIFQTLRQKYATSAGKLNVNLGYTIPGSPRHGKYNFSTSIGAVLTLDQPSDLTQLDLWAERIENFFDLLSAFPPSEKRIRIWLEGKDNGLEVSFRNRLRGGGADSHPFNVFLHRSDNIDISAAFNAYLDQYETLKLMQETTRYLSGKTIRVPEGFLTACNLIEALGAEHAVANQDVSAASTHIAKLIEVNPEYAQSWKTIDRSILKYPSFKAKFDVVAEKAESLGCPVSLKAGTVRDVRAKYRHDLRAVDQDDLIVMQALVGFAWTMGLVELCEKIDIGNDVLLQALSKDVFHIHRGTNIQLWSRKFAKERSSKNSAKQ